MNDKKNSLKSDVYFLLAIVATLTLIGLIFIYSSSYVYADDKFGYSWYFLKRQFFFCLLAIVLFLFFSKIPGSLLKKYTPLLFFTSLVLNLLTFLPKIGLEINGASRWIGFKGMTFQPSELLKLSLFLYIGLFLERKRRNVKSFLYSYLPFWVILGMTFFLLLKQPDFGSVVTILVTSLILLFVAEFKLLHLFFTVLFALPVIVFLILSRAYRLNRILIFLNPWSDPQGKGFQIIQSLIAIGKGHFWGLGISSSEQKLFYVPMQHTDFIFPIIAEETGFVGSCIVISLYALFLYFGLRICLKLKKPFAFFTSLGFVILITLQAIINLMVATGLLPTKGLGLPFISYGGSSLVCLYSMIGLIVNFSSNQKSRI